MSLIDKIWGRICASDGRKVAACYYKGNGETHWVTYGALRMSVTFAQGLVERLTQRRRQYILFLGEASLASVCLLLGILKASCAFMCLKSNCERGDLERLIDKLNVEWIMSNSLSESPMDLASVEEKIQICSEHISVLRTGRKCERCLEADFVYAIQTSGSTGTPKLVQVLSDCIWPNILDLSKKLNIEPSDVIAQSTPLTFDPSLVELFIAFINGATLTVLSSSVKLDPEDLLKAVSQSRINFYQTTPSIFNSWPIFLKNEFLAGRKPKLKTLLLGGERFPLDEITDSLSTSVNIYNIYGITEVSCWASMKKVWPIDGDLKPLADIGTPLSDTIFQVVKDLEDSNLHHLKIGSNTRFCVIDAEELPCLLSQAPIFRDTGDLFKMTNGKLVYAGRSDSLVKRLGHRVSLDLIEAKLSEVENGLKGVCCVTNERRLSLFVQKPIVEGNENDALCRKIKEKLPHHLWPDSIHFVDRFPVTSHGKINRKALLDQERRSKENIRSAFRSIWVHFASDSDLDFLSSGGSSFSALQLIEGLKMERIKVPDDFINDLLLGPGYSHCVDKIIAFNDAVEIEKTEMKPVLKRLPESENMEEIKSKLPRRSPIFTRLKGRLSPDHRLSQTEIQGLSSCSDSLHLETVWKYDLKKCVDSSPLGVIFDDNTSIVIACSHSGRIAVMGIETSHRLICEISLPDRIESSACLSSDNKHFYIGCYDKKLYKIEVNSGRLAWDFETQDMIKCTAVLHENFIYFGSYDGHVYCISEEAQEVWKTKISGPVLAQILVRNGRAFSSSINGGVYCLDARNGTVLWNSKISPSFTNLVEMKRNSEDELLACDVQGCATFLKARTGEDVFKLELNDQIFATPVIAKEKSFVLLAAGSTLHCRQSDAVLTQIWSRRFDSRIVSTPFIYAHYVILADTSGTLHLLRLIDGEILASRRLNGELFSSPIVLNSQIYVGCRDNFLYCVQINAK